MRSRVSWRSRTSRAPGADDWIGAGSRRPARRCLCSILLRPDVGPDQLQLVVAGVALAARAALVRLSGVRPDLKWPNDLIVSDKKIAGLLAEIVSVDDRLAVVVGIGVNLTHAGPATSCPRRYAPSRGSPSRRPPCSTSCSKSSSHAVPSSTASRDRCRCARSIGVHS